MTRPALDRLLQTQHIFDMPLALPGEEATGCAGCVFSTLNECETPAEIAHDPDEAYYDCALLGRNRIWGEEPQCSIADWQLRARMELGEKL
jgi:hypothetical protein